MRIGLGQFNSVVGDLSGNCERMRGIYEQAVRAGVELLVFPELAVCGYPPEDLLYKKSFLRDSRLAVENLAAECPGTTIVAGFAEECCGNKYNAAAVLRDGRISCIYRKGMLPNYGVFDEQRYFSAGGEAVVIDVGAAAVAITICFDIWNIDWLAGFLDASGNIDMVVNISASPFHMGKIAKREETIGRCAKRLRCGVAYCNLVGGQDELIFDGRSMLCDSSGAVVAKAAAFDEDLLIADIDVSRRGGAEIAVVGTPAEQPGDVLDEIYEALVLGTRDYTRKNGFEKVLLGLSGGIDSAVTAAIAADALGAENVVGISMPSKFNSAETRSDAEKLARNLGIEFLEIQIETTLAQFDEALKTFKGWDTKGLAYENLQARIRGCILMSLSNQAGLLVLTTGNKSETAVGYSTLYGDTAGGFGIIKDVLKTVVYQLAERINAKAGREIIPPAVITRAPSAELREDQKDSDSLPDYDLLDEILKGYVEEDKSARELIESGLPDEIVRKVIRLVDRNEYKRRLCPPGIRITPKAFGKDRRLPITNRYDSGKSTG
ncbi:MAG: NAD+ synthase [Sedimentisphaerales bacterium]|nr:NAD+ synthase [Sedimentisphaerales bacterium]